MAMPQFPLNVLGSVLARNRSELVRAVRPEERLSFKCEVGKVCKMNAKGDSEIELIGTATDQGECRAVVHWRLGVQACTPAPCTLGRVTSPAPKRCLLRRLQACVEVHRHCPRAQQEPQQGAGGGGSSSSGDGRPGECLAPEPTPAAVAAPSCFSSPSSACT